MMKYLVSKLLNYNIEFNNKGEDLLQIGLALSDSIFLTRWCSSPVYS